VKVVPKLALTLFAGVFVVVGVFTALRVRGDIEAFDQDVRRDQRVVGLTAGAALARTRTREDAIRLAARVDDSREGMRIRFVSLASGADSRLAPLIKVRPDEFPTPGSSKQLIKPREQGVESADLLVTYVSAPVVDEPFGAIELSQPLASRSEYAWKGIWSGLTSSLAMLIVGGAAMVLIGTRIVGQPVSELIRATRRIAEGDVNVLDSIKRRDEFGELAGALSAMSHDLSAERLRTAREAEKRLQALEQLRHAERLTTLGQLASVLAHEIGTPLNVIAGHGKLVASGRLDPAAIRESAETIGEQSDRITGIVRRILDYARRRPARRMWIDASDLVGRTCALLRGLAERQGVELEVTEPPEAVRLFADPDQLQQVVTNLVLNAIHASPRGEKVKLMTATTARAQSEGGVQELAVLSVSDRGPGIPAEVRDRIFEPFFTTKPAGEGTGLGLSIARDIVAEHGGFMDVSSSPGKGSLFSVYLPNSGPDVQVGAGG
jgi:signal transduction histidine kinase